MSDVATRYIYEGQDTAIWACINLIRDGRAFAVERGMSEKEIRIIVQPRSEKESAAYLHERRQG